MEKLTVQTTPTVPGRGRRIMYIERKAGELEGDARIGWITYSKTRRTIYYEGMEFQSLKGGYKANFYELESGEEYWISGPKKNGADGLYGGSGAKIDDDARENYWTHIREQPDNVACKIS